MSLKFITKMYIHALEYTYNIPDLNKEAGLVKYIITLNKTS